MTIQIYKNQIIKPIWEELCKTLKVNSTDPSLTINYCNHYYYDCYDIKELAVKDNQVVLFVDDFRNEYDWAGIVETHLNWGDYDEEDEGAPICVVFSL